MIDHELLDIGAKAKRHNSSIDWITFRHVREHTRTTHSIDSKLHDRSILEDEGIMVEVSSGGHIGYAAAPSTEKESIRLLIERATNHAVRSSQFPLIAFPSNIRPKHFAERRTKVSQPLFQASSRQLIDRARITCEKMKDRDVVETSCHIDEREITHRLLSTEGLNVHQHFSITGVGFGGVASRNNVTESRYFGCKYTENNQQKGHEYLDEILSENNIQQTREELQLLVDAPICPTGTFDLLLAPTQMVLQIHESIGHPLELDRILGDERNYAGWSFIKKEDFGHLQYGSPLLNIVFDPTIDHQLASFAADDHGSLAVQSYLIKEGKLMAGIGGAESQFRSQIPGCSTARACSWNRSPIDRMSNINLLPGKESEQSLLSNVERGVYMCSNNSWSIDDYRNKFQFGCEFGRMIENGKLTHVVRQPGYRGVTTPFWNSLVGVGDLSTFRVHGVPNCGKGEPNQMQWVGHATPMGLFKNIEIFGSKS